MNWKHIEERWDQFGVQIRERWGRLTDDDIARARGGRAELVSCVIERYGVDLGFAERHVDGWLNSIEAFATTRLQQRSDAWRINAPGNTISSGDDLIS
jgi:uncharacterized protein YjbJ (UPF0337 family)